VKFGLENDELAPKSRSNIVSVFSSVYKFESNCVKAPQMNLTHLSARQPETHRDPLLKSKKWKPRFGKPTTAFHHNIEAVMMKSP